MHSLGSPQAVTAGLDGSDGVSVMQLVRGSAPGAFEPLPDRLSTQPVTTPTTTSMAMTARTRPRTPPSMRVRMPDIDAWGISRASGVCATLVS
jgi:hypothetical protein